MFQHPLNSYAKEIDSSGSVQRQEELKQIALANGFIPQEAPAEYVARIICVFDANIQALHHYKPDNYTGQVDLLLTQEGQDSDIPGVWRRLVQGELNVHRVEGNHYSMLQPPHVEQVVSFLSGLLDNDAGSEPYGLLVKDVKTGVSPTAYRIQPFSGFETSTET